MTIITRKNDYVLIRINCEIYNPIFLISQLQKSPGATCITISKSPLSPMNQKSDSEITFLILSYYRFIFLQKLSVQNFYLEKIHFLKISIFLKIPIFENIHFSKKNSHFQKIHTLIISILYYKNFSHACTNDEIIKGRVTV